MDLGLRQFDTVPNSQGLSPFDSLLFLLNLLIFVIFDGERLALWSLLDCVWERLDDGDDDENE